MSNGRGVDYVRLLIDTSNFMMLSMDCNPHHHHHSKNNNNNRQYSSFVQSVFKQGRMTYSIVIVGLLYLARFRHALCSSLHRPNFTLEMERRSPDFVPKIFMAALLLSTKFLCDRHDTNATWALTHNMSLEQVNRLETLFLIVVNYKLAINERSFNAWMAQLFAPPILQIYSTNISISPPTPPYHLDDFYEQKIAEKRRRLEQVQ